MREQRTEAPDMTEPTVTVEVRVNGRRVKGFPHRLLNEQHDLTPEKAKRLMELWQELTRG